jgi:branched-chain amino acid transport system substrate-binding protein
MRNHAKKLFLLIIPALFFLLVQGCIPKIAVQPKPFEKRENKFQMAEKYFEAGAYDKALEQYGAFVRQYPQSVLAPAALMRTAQIHSDRKNYDAARFAYERIIREHSYSVFAPDAGVEILALLFKQKKYSELIGQSGTIPQKTLSRIHIIRISVLKGDSFLAMGVPADAAVAYIDALVLATTIERETLREKLIAAYVLLDDKGRRAVESRLNEAGDLALVETLRQMAMFRKDTVGCLLPLTGSYEAYGQKALKGIELALNRLSLEEGRSFKIIVKDTASNPEKAAQLVNDLFDEKAACIIGPLGEAKAAARAAQERKIPIIVLSQAEGIPGTGDYVFRNFITPKMQAQTLVRYAVERLGARRFAILYPKEKYGAAFMELFREAVIQKNGEIFAVEAYDTLGTDFSEPIGRLAAKCRQNRPEVPQGPDKTGSAVMEMGLAGPVDVVFIPDSPKKASLIVPQLTYYDVKNVQLFGTNLWHSDEFVKMAGPSAQGAIVPDGFFHLSVSYPVRTFVAAYQSAYGELPGFIEAVSYDTAMIVFHVLSGSGITHRSRIRDALADMPPFDGVTGLTAFDETGEAEKQLFLLKVTGNGFAEVGP